MTVALKPKTSSVILKILKFLIQNQALGVNIKSKPNGEKTRGIASLHYDIMPPEAKGYFEEICAAKGLMINRHVTPKGQVLKGSNSL